MSDTIYYMDTNNGNDIPVPASELGGGGKRGIIHIDTDTLTEDDYGNIWANIPFKDFFDEDGNPASIAEIYNSKALGSGIRRNVLFITTFSKESVMDQIRYLDPMPDWSESVDYVMGYGPNTCETNDNGDKLVLSTSTVGFVHTGEDSPEAEPGYPGYFYLKVSVYVVSEH